MFRGFRALSFNFETLELWKLAALGFRSLKYESKMACFFRCLEVKRVVNEFTRYLMQHSRIPSRNSRILTLLALMWSTASHVCGLLLGSCFLTLNRVMLFFLGHPLPYQSIGS